MARCPVHNDKDFATSISQLPSGKVIAYCHACGAKGDDIYKALGLPFDELFGEAGHGEFVPQHIKEKYELDKFLIKVYEADVARNKAVGFYDRKRVKKAQCRIAGLERKYGHLLQ